MSSADFRRFGHQNRRFNAPIGETRFQTIAEKLSLNSRHELLDLGCGTGEWLLRLVQSTGACGVGVDSDGLALEEAARRACQRGLADRVTWLEGEAKPILSELDRRFSAVVCVGASHAFGGWRGLLEATSSSVTSDGLLLLGEGFWERPPSKEYLDFLGDMGLGDFADIIFEAEKVGWDCIWSTSATLDEWDQFEWEFFAVANEFARLHPHDEAADENLENRRRWRDAYLRWGRGTMGFAYYIFRQKA